MILIGQYDSPFVRRVAIAMRLYGFDYEQRPWSGFGDAGQIARYNPLRRVPTLVTADDEALIESSAILDWLDELAGPDRALIPRHGLTRRRALKVCSLATGVADKCVSLVYEREVHRRATEFWVERCRTQIEGALDLLEDDRGARPDSWWFGPEIGHADIAVACVLRFMREALPGVFAPARYAALTAHAKACEALPVFGEISQRFFLTPAKA